MLFKRSVLFLLITLCLGFKTEPRLLFLEGLVTVDGVPVSAQIEISSIQKSSRISEPPGTVNGNFSTKLPIGSEYEIVVKVDHFPQQVISLNTNGLDSTHVVNIFADFTSPEYDRKLEELIKSTEEILKKYKTFNAKDFSSRFGNAKKEQLEYKVQIGAFKFYENFNYNNVLGLPKIIRKAENDQITRFTMGSFETYNQAQVLLEKLQKNNLKDAFIVASYMGERKILQQLLEEKIVY